MLCYLKMGLQHEIKHRVNFTKNIKRILESLKMIAAMRSKKMSLENKYALQFKKSIEQTYINTFHNNFDAKKTLYILIGAKKGLCGSFVMNLNIMLKNKFPAIDTETNTQWIIIGGKNPNYIKQIKEENILFTNEIPINDQEIMEIAELIYNERTKFRKISILSWTLSDTEPQEQIIFDLNLSTEEETNQTVIAHDYNQTLTQQEIKNLIIFSIFNELNFAITGSIAREEKTRLLAMDQAITNSDEMLIKLQRQFNQVRQASITNEINEIISGAEFA